MNEQLQTVTRHRGRGPGAAPIGGQNIRPARRAIYLVLLIAAALRLAVFISARHAIILEPRGFLDDAYYHSLAWDVAGGDLMLRPISSLEMSGGPSSLIGSNKPFFLSPLYIYFLGLVYFLFSGGLAAPFIIQSLAGLAAVWLVFKTAESAYGAAAGLAAGTLMALDGLAGMYGCTILAASLDPLLTSLFFYALLHAARGNRPRSWVLAGLSAGLLALNRPNALVLIPLTALVPLWKEKAAGTKPAALCLAAAALAIAPATIRNYVVSREIVLITSNGGLNFYIGNRAGAPGYYLAPEWMDSDVRGQMDEAKKFLERRRGRTLDNTEVSSILYGMAWSEIEAHPAAWARLLGYKILLLFNAREAALNLSLPYMRREVEPALWFFPVGMWLLIPLGAAGLAASRKQRETRLIAFMALAHGATVAMFFVSDRYRLPLHVPLALLAGAGVQGIIAAWRERKTPELVMALAAFTAALLISAPDVGAPSGEGQVRLNHALRLVQAGRAGEAHDLIGKMPEGAMNPFVWRMRLGRAYAAVGQWDYAAEQFNILAALLPENGPLRCAIGRIYLLGGQVGPARKELEVGVGLSPDDQECRANLEQAKNPAP